MSDDIHSKVYNSYYIIRDGRTPNTIIVIQRVYDSALACFQTLINNRVEAIDLYRVGTNGCGLVIEEKKLHSYNRVDAVLCQHATAGVHHESNIAPLTLPTNTGIHIDIPVEKSVHCYEP